MPTTIYDSSLVTQRNKNKIIANSFINRIENPSNPTTGSAPLLGITQQSIINEINSGRLIQVRKNNGCTVVDYGCPCGERYTSSNDIHDTLSSSLKPAISPLAASPIIDNNESNIRISSIDIDNNENIYAIVSYSRIYYASNLNVLFYNLDTIDSTKIQPSLYGTYTLPEASNNYVFMIKYNSIGKIEWITSITGAIYLNDSISSTIDSNGNIYIIGHLKTTGIFLNEASIIDNNKIISFEPVGRLNSSIDNSCYIVKYTSLGKFAAAYYIDIRGVYYTIEYAANTIVVYGQVNQNTNRDIIAYGYKGVLNRGPNGIIELSTLTLTLPYTTMFRAFIATFSVDTHSPMCIIDIHSTSSGSIIDIYGSTLIVDNNNIYITGRFFEDLNISNYISRTNDGLISTAPYGILKYTKNPQYIEHRREHLFIIKYGLLSLNVEIATAIEPSYNDIDSSFQLWVHNIHVDSQNNIYLCGIVEGTIIIHNPTSVVNNNIIQLTQYGILNKFPEFPSIFCIKYNSSLIVQWVNIINPPLPKNNRLIAPTITSDKFNNIYILFASTTSTVTIFNPSTVVNNNIQCIENTKINSMSSIIIVKYVTTGNVVSTSNISLNTDSNSMSIYKLLTIVKENNMYIATTIQNANGFTLYNNASSNNNTILSTTLQASSFNKMQSFLVKGVLLN
jgi:hypothetical protein